MDLDVEIGEKGIDTGLYIVVVGPFIMDSQDRIAMVLQYVSNAGRVSLAELKRYVNGMLSRIAGEGLEVSSVLLNQIT